MTTDSAHTDRLLPDGTGGVFDYVSPVAGVATFKVVPNEEGCIEILHLETCQPRTGAGRAAVVDFLTWAAARGYHQVRADSVRGALGFWAKLGFVDSGSRDGCLHILGRAIAPSYPFSSHQGAAHKRQTMMTSSNGPTSFHAAMIQKSAAAADRGEEGTCVARAACAIGVKKDESEMSRATAAEIAAARREALVEGAELMEQQHTWITNTAASAALRRLAMSDRHGEESAAPPATGQAADAVGDQRRNHALWPLIEAYAKSMADQAQNPSHESAKAYAKLARSNLQDALSEMTRPHGLPPVEHDLLPPIGSQVLIHLSSRNEWVEHTVVGYYVWGDLHHDPRLQRVNVRVTDAAGHLNARMLADVRHLDGTPCVPETDATDRDDNPRPRS